MKKPHDKYQFIFDNNSNNWFFVDTKSDKYKFYARVSKRKENKEYETKEKEKVKL